MNAVDMLRPVPGLDVKRPAALGKVFYVDEYGARVSDSNEGTDPDQPLQKIETAIGKCANDNGDYVIVLDCYSADTFAITVNKSTCHILGLALPAPWQWTVLNGGGTDVFQIDANYVEIAGFGMISAAADGISIGNIGYGWLHHLSFGFASTAMVDGIKASTGTPTSFLVEDCFFGGNAAACLSGNGISGALTDWVIRNNVFRKVGLKGITISGSMNIAEIFNNRFAVPEANSEAAGWAITLAAGCKEGVISHNFAAEGASQSGNNPYLDQSTNSATTLLNAWIQNYDYDTIVAPDTA